MISISWEEIVTYLTQLLKGGAFSNLNKTLYGSFISPNWTAKSLSSSAVWSCFPVPFHTNQTPHKNWQNLYHEFRTATYTNSFRFHHWDPSSVFSFKPFFEKYFPNPHQFTFWLLVFSWIWTFFNWWRVPYRKVAPFKFMKNAYIPPQGFNSLLLTFDNSLCFFSLFTSLDHSITLLYWAESGQSFRFFWKSSSISFCYVSFCQFIWPNLVSKVFTGVN